MDEDSQIIADIQKLKKDLNAVILAHNYQLGEVQDVADICGDSLDLSRKAAETEADVIVFCGVHFMAETAAILSPQKKVLLPDLNSGCPMADMADAESLRELKSKHPGAVVVTYVNSTAGVKAESDICCTSANAVRVVESIPRDKKIIFVPDRYLGTFASDRTSRELVLWPGHCPTHRRILPEHIQRRKVENPGARVIVHPECRPEVIRLADKAASTSQMIRYASETDAKTIIVGTELGIIHRLAKENPDKRFVPATEQAICPDMKLITLEKVRRALEEKIHVVEVPEEVRRKALGALQRMLEVT